MLTRNPLDLPATGRIAAFDYGTRSVGVALSTSDQKSCASAAPLLPQGGFEGVLNAFKAAYGSAVVAAVVGLPLNMDGSVGKSADAARSFAGVVAKVLGVPVLLWDERLTSKQSEAAFFEQRPDGREGRRQTRASKKDSGGRTDSGAAVLILQSALDARR